MKKIPFMAAGVMLTSCLLFTGCKKAQSDESKSYYTDQQYDSLNRSRNSNNQTYNNGNGGSSGSSGYLKNDSGTKNYFNSNQSTNGASGTKGLGGNNNNWNQNRNNDHTSSDLTDINVFQKEDEENLYQEYGYSRGDLNYIYRYQYDVNSIDTIRGEVLKVMRVKYPDGDCYIVVLIRSDHGDVLINLGPVWYLDQNGIIVDEGDTLFVKGSKVRINGRYIFIAAELRSDGEYLRLRDVQGNPVWLNTHSGQAGAIESGAQQYQPRNMNGIRSNGSQSYSNSGNPSNSNSGNPNGMRAFTNGNSRYSSNSNSFSSGSSPYSGSGLNGNTTTNSPGISNNNGMTSS
jgi:hypothetical protein